MNSKEVCLELIAAESEAAVQRIVEREREMADAGNWRPLDGRETNFNVTSNQASDGGKALTELMTNMVDAILLKRAYEEGIDPKSPSSPKTMYEAVDRLVKNMHGGKLTSLDPNQDWLRTFALDNLLIGVTGAKNRAAGFPCYTFSDNGEGQVAERFPQTFLSLSAGTKKDIPFVQGKYNMGSSGVLGYCGLLGFKLIVSRRFNLKEPWAWTLVRKRPNKGMPVFEYLVLPNGFIPTFEADKLYPFYLATGEVFSEVSRRSGTVIKLYDYQIGNDFLSFKGSREALNENLIETVLPFRILDFRQKPDVKRNTWRRLGIDERSFNGMEWLLLRTHSVKKNGEEDEEDTTGPIDPTGQEEISVAVINHPTMGEIRIRAVVLKSGKLPDWLNPRKHINRVFHAVHGQVQYKQTRGFLSDCGYPALKDRVVIFVDASNLTFEAHNGVWKADREHVNRNIWGQEYLDEVKAAIRESKELKALQQRIAQEELDTAVGEESIELFEKLVRDDKNFAALLVGHPPRISIFAGAENGSNGNAAEPYKGKHSPTLLRFDERVRKKTIGVPINSRRPIAAETDAENEYFDRPEDPGSLVISDEAAASFAVRTQLKDGRIVFFIEPITDNVRIGQQFEFKVSLVNEGNQHLDVSDSCKLCVLEPEEKPDPTPRPPRPKFDEAQPGLKNGNDNNATQPSLALPLFQFTTRDGRRVGETETAIWPDGFTDKEGGFVKDLGDGRLKYFINYDNVYHIASKQRQKGEVAKAATTEKYKWSMLVLMLSYEQAIRTLPEEERANLSDSLEQIRSVAAKGAAATVLTISEVIPRILDTSNIETE